MRSRIELDDILRAIAGDDRVYFDAPEDLQMEYPCIRYSLGKIDNQYANNTVYSQTRKYNIVTMDFEPDSELTQKVSLLPCCEHIDHYQADGIHHDRFTLEF